MSLFQYFYQLLSSNTRFFLQSLSYFPSLSPLSSFPSLFPSIFFSISFSSIFFSVSFASIFLSVSFPSLFILSRLFSVSDSFTHVFLTHHSYETFFLFQGEHRLLLQPSISSFKITFYCLVSYPLNTLFTCPFYSLAYFTFILSLTNFCVLSSFIFLPTLCPLLSSVSLFR